MAEIVDTRDWLGFVENEPLPDGRQMSDQEFISFKKELLMIGSIFVMGYAGVRRPQFQDRLTGEPENAKDHIGRPDKFVRRVQRSKLIPLVGGGAEASERLGVDEGSQVFARIGQERDGVLKRLPLQIGRLPFVKGRMVLDPSDYAMHDSDNGGFFIDKYVSKPGDNELIALPREEDAYLPLFDEVSLRALNGFSDHLSEVREGLIEKDPKLFWDLSGTAVILAAHKRVMES